MNTTRKEVQTITVVLFFCNHRTGQFGQGTFVNALLPLFNSAQNNFRLLIVHTDSFDSRELKYQLEGNTETVSIPPYPGVHRLTGENTMLQKQYACYLAEKIFPYLKHKNNLLFWVNSVDYLNLSSILKEMLPDSKLLYVHHSFSWKYLINVDDTQFSHEWKNSNHTIHPLAFEMTSYQQEMAALSDATVTVTHHAHDFFRNTLNIPESKLYTIYNGGTSPSESGNRLRLRRKYGISARDRIILFSGRIVKNKGIQELIEAFGILLNNLPNARLIVIGSGDITPYLTKIATHWSRVTLTGPLSSDQISEFYRIADVGVLPSLHEQCSFTAIEMMFHRLPLIVTAVDGLDEIFEHQVDAVKIPVQCDHSGHRKLNPESIASGILSIINDRSKKALLVKNARNKAARDFSLEEMQQSYSNLFQSLFSI